jgi:hypothetical protein
LQTPSRAVRAASTAIVAIVFVLLVAPMASAAGPVSIEARGLLGGRFSAGGWLGLAITLANDGAPVTGYVAADTTDGVARRLVELPAGARKQVMLFVQPEPFQRSVEVRFEVDDEELAAADVAVDALDSGLTHVVIISDGGGSLRPQILARGQAGTPEPIDLAASDLPERAEPLRGIKAIVWAADSTVLSDGQHLSLERWVASGGHLVVIGGPDWQARTAAFAEILPVLSLAALDGASADQLATWVGADAPPAGEQTAATGTLAPDAQQLVALDESGTQPLLAVGSRGAGRVSYVALDLATAAFQGWDGSARLWARLLPDNRLAAQFGGFPIEEEAANAMTQALSNLPALDVPPAELLLAVIVGYILLIGPISYLVLRRVDRRELAWVTAPLLVVLFSACSYGIGSSMKGSQIIVNEISLVRTTIGGAAASVQTYAGVFSPTRATYDLTVRADALLAPLRSQAFEPVPVEERSYLMEQGDPARLRGLEVSVFGFQSVRAESVVAYSPSLEVEWQIDGDAITGTVRNGGDAPIEDVAVINTTGGEMVGDLDPGESDEFTFSLRNFNGSAAADQVYGFANFDPSDPTVREVMARRETISSLVGYGGWFPGMESQFGFGGDRGPFVIGWVEGESPVTVDVEDESVQRYSHTVEVVAGRPRLGPGEVTLQPSQLSVQVVGGDGEASTSDPTFVTLGNGEVTFAIALPLEAAALEPTSVTIMTGQDPSMVMANQGNFGFMPPGYRIAGLDPRSGEWVDLGDLSQASSFEVDDPSSVLDETGRIEVRVTGAGIPANFGQTPIFVSASVEGVVP